MDAEVAAALAKAVRTGIVKDEVARNVQRRFAGDWPDFVRVAVTESLVERAEGLAWEHGLRGYDSVHLASALTWQESVGEEIVLAISDVVREWKEEGRPGLSGRTPTAEDAHTNLPYTRAVLQEGPDKAALHRAATRTARELADLLP